MISFNQPLSYKKKNLLCLVTYYLVTRTIPLDKYIVPKMTSKIMNVYVSRTANVP